MRSTASLINPQRAQGSEIGRREVGHPLVDGGLDWSRPIWSAPAERSGDGAFLSNLYDLGQIVERRLVHAKAASRSACRRTPKRHRQFRDALTGSYWRARAGVVSFRRVIPPSERRFHGLEMRPGQADRRHLLALEPIVYHFGGRPVPVGTLGLSTSETAAGPGGERRCVVPQSD
jgi:hypothetical protein